MRIMEVELSFRGRSEIRTSSYVLFSFVKLTMANIFHSICINKKLQKLFEILWWMRRVGRPKLNRIFPYKLDNEIKTVSIIQ